MSKENIEHEVTDYTFCDCKVKWSVSLAEFLSFLENITVEKTEDLKRIDIDRTDPWCVPARCLLQIVSPMLRYLITWWSSYDL